VSLLQLQPGFDYPDRIRAYRGADTCECGGGEVDERRFNTVVEVISDELFAVAVGEEVDGASGYDADESGTQALEESSRGFVSVNIPERSIRILD
jgi:hypothetical protein